MSRCSTKTAGIASEKLQEKKRKMEPSCDDGCKPQKNGMPVAQGATSKHAYTVDLTESDGEKLGFYAQPKHVCSTHGLEGDGRRITVIDLLKLSHDVLRSIAVATSSSDHTKVQADELGAPSWSGFVVSSTAMCDATCSTVCVQQQKHKNKPPFGCVRSSGHVL